MLKKNKPVPFSAYPPGVPESVKLLFKPAPEHPVDIPLEYQVKVASQLPNPENFVSPQEAKSIQLLPGILRNSYSQLRGISATGKGTRVAHLLFFLMEKFKWTFHIEDTWAEPTRAEIAQGAEPKLIKNAPLGYYFPELNLFILGRFVKSNKSRLLSLTGADSYLTMYGHSSLFESLYRWANPETGMNLIFEGYAGMDNPKLNPKAVHENSGQCCYFYQMYEHPSKEEMLTRFKSRSFHVAKGDAAYIQNEPQASQSYQIIKEDLKELGLPDGFIQLQSSTQPVYEFGKRYLEFLGVGHLSDEFEAWCNTNDLKRDYLNVKDNYDKFWLKLQFQDQFANLMKDKG